MQIRSRRCNQFVRRTAQAHRQTHARIQGRGKLNLIQNCVLCSVVRAGVCGAQCEPRRGTIGTIISY